MLMQIENLHILIMGPEYEFLFSLDSDNLLARNNSKFNFLRYK